MTIGESLVSIVVSKWLGACEKNSCVLNEGWGLAVRISGAADPKERESLQENMGPSTF